MDLSAFLERLKSTPDTLDFEDTMSVIDAAYEFTPTAFKNGDTSNAAGENNGSCKIFAFAQLHELNAEETLACFGRYYRDDVLKHPDGTDHGNIRNFMQHGWIGVDFESNALAAKS